MYVLTAARVGLSEHRAAMASDAISILWRRISSLEGRPFLTGSFVSITGVAAAEEEEDSYFANADGNFPDMVGAGVGNDATLIGLTLNLIIY